MNIKEFCEEIGYTPITTYWEDFTIADKFVGVEKDPIGDTFKRALEYAKTDYKVFTELVLILNWKIWYWYDKDILIAQTYNKLWEKAEDLFFKTFKDNEEAKRYYFKTTD